MKENYMHTPLVSICCQTYNHKSYIKKAIESFIMQKVNFSFEILIRDDASTDGTQEILLEYSKKYSDLINPLIYTENQYKKGVSPFLDNVKRANGKYIAICEGDDFWTDPYKLQKQVDFLEANPDFSLVCGGYDPYDEEKKKFLKSKVFYDKNKNSGFEFTLESNMNKTIRWITHPLTVVFRMESINLNKFIEYKYFMDTHLFYHILEKSKGYYFSQVFAVYRHHYSGMFSKISRFKKREVEYDSYKEIYDKNKSLYSRKLYFLKTRALFNFILYNNTNSEYDKFIKKINLLVEMFFIIRNLQEFISFLKSFFPSKMKQYILKLFIK